MALGRRLHRSRRLKIGLFVDQVGSILLRWGTRGQLVRSFEHLRAVLAAIPLPLEFQATATEHQELLGSRC